MSVRDWYCLGFVHHSAQTYGTSYSKTHTSRVQDGYHPGLVHCTCTALMIHYMANTHREFRVGTSHSTQDTSHDTHTARVQDQYSSGLVCHTSHTIHHKAHTQSSGLKWFRVDTSYSIVFLWFADLVPISAIVFAISIAINVIQTCLSDSNDVSLTLH